jgi:uncharacterized protein involved in exopolysaccharide biosynthesis
VAIETKNPIGLAALDSAARMRDLHPLEASVDYTPRISLRSLMEVWFRHPARIAIVAGLPLLVTALLLLFMPKRYMATMQLAVLNTRQYSVITSDSGQPNKAVEDISDADVNSQAQLLRSRDVLSQTLDQLGKPSSPAIARDRAIESLDTRLDVEPVRESNILNVAYVDSSPDKAKTTLQALATSFVAKELSVVRPMQGEKPFLGLVEKRQQELAAAQGEFAKFKVDTGIASLKDDEGSLLRQLESLSSESTALTSELALERRQAQRTDDELARHPERITTQNRSTPNQAAIESLTALLVQLQNKRTTLASGYQASDRVVQDVDEQIRNTQTQLAQLRAGNSLETTTDMNPLNLELKSQLARAQISGAATAAKRQAVLEQKQTYEDQLAALEQKAAEFEDLQKRVTEAQTNLDFALQKRDQAAVDDALDRDRILNVAFAAKPSASSIPVQPRPAMYLATGLFMSAFFAVVVSIVTEMGRKTIYSPAELDAFTGVTTLATIPLQKLHSAGSWSRVGAGEEESHIGRTSIHDSQLQGSLQPIAARSES